MFVRCKYSGVVQECVNKDAIKYCVNNPDSFTVSETLEGLTSKSQPILPEEKPEEIKPVLLEQEEEKMDADDLNSKTLKELQTIAKQMGITGYSNMSKMSLLAVIKNMSE